MKAKSEFQQSTLACSKHSFNIYFRMKTEFIKTVIEHVQRKTLFHPNLYLVIVRLIGRNIVIGPIKRARGLDNTGPQVHRKEISKLLSGFHISLVQFFLLREANTVCARVCV